MYFFVHPNTSSKNILLAAETRQSDSGQKLLQNGARFFFRGTQIVRAQ